MSGSAESSGTAQSPTSWLPRSNFVDRSALEIQPSEQFGVTEGIVETARERTEEFIEEYPDRARLPMTRDPDEKLLSSYVIEEYREEHVEPEKEFETGFTVRRRNRAVPVSWAEAFFLTLIDRHQYDGGVSGRFVDRQCDEEFNVPFVDAWTTEYGEKQQAMTAGAQRQLMGGEYPEHEQSARSGEFEPGTWGKPLSVLWGQTGSSVPGDERVPPIDHARSVNTWTGHCYDRVRNLVEHKWGVPKDRWCFMRAEDAHGVEDDAEINAGYTHTHPVLWVDVEAADGLPDLPDEKLESHVEKRVHDDVLTKHVEECELAGSEAHDVDSVTATFGVEKPGAYAAGYALPGDEKPLIEQSVEYIAWATTMRAMGRRRIARSQLMTKAAKADMCKQDPERSHGVRLEYDRSGHNDELVCSECGSPVGIGETMTAHRTGSAQAVATDGGEAVEKPETVVVGARVGEPTERANVRERVEKYIQNNGDPGEVSAGVLGEMGIPPRHEEVVHEVLAGETSDGPESVEGPQRESGTSRYELQELTAWNGDSETPNGGGGARYVEMEMPVEEVIRGSRLRHVEAGCRPKIVVHVEGERIATYNRRTAARKLINAGLRIPWVADRSLSFEETESAVFDEPVESPGDRSG